MPPAGPSRVAIACDDGCLRLFKAEAGEPGLLYEASFAPAASRLLSVAWHPIGNTIVAGTADGSLHAWSLNTKREVLQVRTGKHTPFSRFYHTHRPIPFQTQSSCK